MERRTTAIAAKVNLVLKITGKRADGYHELATLFLPLAEPHDDLSWVPAPSGAGLAVTSDDPELPGGEANLAGRAALLYAGRCGLACDWHFHIAKRIPVAGGMGGGSADAAGVLRLLNARYRKLDADALAGLALELGADVPGFLIPGPSWARGVGEILTPLGAVPEELPLVIAAPDFPTSARWAYRHLDPAQIGPADPELPGKLMRALAAGDWPLAAGMVFNDLEPALLGKFPLLELLRGFILANGGLNATVSGSGPTLFALARGRADREALIAAGRREFPGVRWIAGRPWKQEEEMP